MGGGAGSTGSCAIVASIERLSGLLFRLHFAHSVRQFALLFSPILAEAPKPRPSLSSTSLSCRDQGRQHWQKRSNLRPPPEARKRPLSALHYAGSPAAKPLLSYLFLNTSISRSGGSMSWRTAEPKAKTSPIRARTVGFLGGRMVVLAWTPRNGARRIVSMRKAND